MESTLTQYYQGITQKLRADIDSINTLFEHQGTKGEGNENVLRDLICKFLPKRFGVGSGTVIDKHGSQSAQCDIVIYDKFFYPSILSLASVAFYPVDIVYATIEIKTRLTSCSAKESIKNIESVRSLKIVPDKFMLFGSKGGRAVATQHEPTHPVGCVFSYDTDATQASTFKNWFSLKEGQSHYLMPSLVSSLDQGLIQRENFKPDSGRTNELLIPVMRDGRPVSTSQSEARVEFENVIYPVKQIQGKRVLVDQAKVLLNFLLQLNSLLNERKLNPELDVTEHYLSDTFVTGVII